MKTKTLAALAAISLIQPSHGQTKVVVPFLNTGGFNINEMAIDIQNGDLYVNGFSSGSSTLSVQKATGTGLVQLYATMPGSYNGANLTYTNGFAVHDANLWWNNANSGPGTLTELSRAPKAGGTITRTSPTNDLDSLASDGTTLFSAYYAGTPCTVDANGNVNYLSSYRSTSHLALAAEAGILYVADDSGLYRRNTNGSYSVIRNDAGRYLTNGSRLGVGGGKIYALDRNTHNGYWTVDIATGTASFSTNPVFVFLNAVCYYNGDLYLSDTGEAQGSLNADGHIWKVTNVFILTAVATHGSVTGGGNYAPGSTATVTATAAPGYIFSSWSGDASGGSNPANLTMDSDKSVTANFAEDTADPDGDDLTNYQEIVLHQTDPNDADSDHDGFKDGYEVAHDFNPLSIASSPEGGMTIYTAVEIEFGAAQGQNYRVEASTDLQNWVPVESGIPGNGGRISRLYSTRYDSRRYFRSVRE